VPPPPEEPPLPQPPTPCAFSQLTAASSQVHPLELAHEVEAEPAEPQPPPSGWQGPLLSPNGDGDGS
jgi:hypothetical protein